MIDALVAGKVYGQPQPSPKQKSCPRSAGPQMLAHPSPRFRPKLSPGSKAILAETPQKWSLLWEGRAKPPTDSGTSAPFAAQPSSKSGRAATIPSGSSRYYTKRRGGGSNDKSQITKSTPEAALG
jgi:hypothetical protein